MIGYKAPAKFAMECTILCPKCQQEMTLTVTPPQADYIVRCLHCQTEFQARILKIRAKRSRGNKSAGGRKFEVRVIDFVGQEELIEFRNARYKDFELRQGDMAVFSFVADKLKLVQNLTINESYQVSEPKCYLATHAYGENSE